MYSIYIAALLWVDRCSYEFIPLQQQTAVHSIDLILNCSHIFVYSLQMHLAVLKGKLNSSAMQTEGQVEGRGRTCNQDILLWKTSEEFNG